MFVDHQIRSSWDRMRSSHPLSPRDEWRRFTVRVVVLMALFWAGLFALVSAELVGEWPLMIAILLVIPAISFFQRRWNAAPPPVIAGRRGDDRNGGLARPVIPTPVAGNDP